jgi:hypothetical protein
MGERLYSKGIGSLAAAPRVITPTNAGDLLDPVLNQPLSRSIGQLSLEKQRLHFARTKALWYTLTPGNIYKTNKRGELEAGSPQAL